MCDHCFTSLIHKFKSPKELAVLQTIIQEKIYSNKLSALNSNPHSFFAPFIPYHLYKCSACSETWMLSMPESHKGGFFLTRKSAVDYKKELHQKVKLRTVGFLIAAIILVAISVIMLIL